MSDALRREIAILRDGRNMSEMMERICRGLASANCTLKEEAERLWPEWEDDARLVLEILRDPTPKMLKAACGAMSPSKRPSPERVGSKEKHKIRYQAMIAAALSPADRGSP